MARILDSLRSGDWLQQDRLRVYPLVIVTVSIVATAYVLFSHGGFLPNGSPFGSDFVSFWVAAREALSGRPEVPYLAADFARAQDAIFGDGNFYAFFYPPHYLAYVLPFGLLPYYAALAAWSGLGLLAALWVISAIAGRRPEVVLLVLAFPATFLTVAHGQNAFLSAALFGGALLLLDRRPIIAGILFGLLTFKPQLGLLIPLALLAGGYWRTIFSAIATTLAVAAFSALLFGVNTWALFIVQGADAMATLSNGYVEWSKMISTYAMLRVSGLAHVPAMTVQACVSVAVACVVVWAWRPRNAVAFAFRAALLLTGALLATPFGLNYDLFVLAPAIAFAAAHGMRHGFAPWQKSLLAFAYLSPVVMLWLTSLKIAVAPFVLAALFVHFAVLAFAGTTRGQTALPAAAE
jgi:hypothetical protein